MGVFDVFKKSGSVSKNDIVKKPEKDEHLTRLIKSGTTLYFKSGDYGKKVPLILKKIGEKRIAFKAVSVFPEKEGAKITVEYETMGRRYKFETKIFSYKEDTGIILASFPSVIRDNERRRVKRIGIPNRGRFRVNVLAMKNGIGFSGDVVNLSTLGLSMYVERAIDIRTEKELQIKEKLFTAGMDLGIIRFKSESSKEVEISGKLIYVIKDGPKLRVGIEFNKLSDNALSIVKSILMKYTAL